MAGRVRPLIAVAMAIVGAVTLLTGTPAGAGTGTLDQSLEPAGTGQGICFSRYAAQFFVPARTGYLDRAEVAFRATWGTTTVEAELDVRVVDLRASVDFDPFSAPTLASAPALLELEPSTGGWVVATYGTPAAVEAGGLYALVVETADGGDLGGCTVFWESGLLPEGGSYPSPERNYGLSWCFCEMVVTSPPLAFRTYVATGLATDADGDGAEATEDCDDDDPGRYPGLAEVANDGVDQSCDGYDQVTYYVDGDADTYGDTATAHDVDGPAPAGSATRGGDADDADPTVHPGAPELCDGLDNDQDSTADEGWPDADGDGMADCVDPDDDDDGVVDGEDPDRLVEAVGSLPAGSISAGHRKAFVGRLGLVEAALVAGDPELAISELEALRKRVDGCTGRSGERPDKNDWVRDCTDQLVIRDLIDGLLGELHT